MRVVLACDETDEYEVFVSSGRPESAIHAARSYVEENGESVLGVKSCIKVEGAHCAVIDAEQYAC